MSEQEQNQLFEEYGNDFSFRDDGKLKLRQRGKRRVWFVSGLIIVTFLVISGLVSYAASLASPHSARSFATPLPEPRPTQPPQQVLSSQRLSIGDTPNILVRNPTGNVIIKAGAVGAVVIEFTTSNPVDQRAINSTRSDHDHTLTIQVGRIPSGSTSNSIDLTITLPYNSNLDVHAKGYLDISHIDGRLVLTAESIHVFGCTLHGRSSLQATSYIDFLGGLDPQGTEEFHCGSSIQLELPRNGSFHLDINSHGAVIANSFKKVDIGPAPRATVIISAYGLINISSFGFF